MAGIYRKFRKFLIHNVLHADDTPHRIAVGIAVGVFVGLTPTVGFQMVIAVAVAAALRANKVVCIPMVWITNPVTLVPIYAACFRIGSALTGLGAATASHEATAQLTSLEAAGGMDRWVELGFWKELLQTITRVGAELWVGCLFVGSIAAVIAYFASRWGVSAYRERRAIRLAARGRVPREQRRRSRRLSEGRSRGGSSASESMRSQTLSPRGMGAKTIPARGPST